MKQIIFFLATLGTLMGCGVKGDPLPPEEPAYIGRGEPSFKKAVQRFDIRTDELEDEKEVEEADEDEE